MDVQPDPTSLLLHNPSYHSLELRSLCQKQRGKRGGFHSLPAVFIVKAGDSSPGPFCPLPSPQNPMAAPAHAEKQFGWVEKFSQSPVFSAHPSVMGREVMPSAQPGPKTPPMRDLEAESILPNSTHLKGNTGFIPKSKQGSFPSCKLSAGDAVSAWMELHALAAPGMWHCCHCCPHPSYLVWWLTTLPMAGG